MEKAEYVDRVAIREKVCTGCTMLVDGVCCDADPCENLIAGFLEEPPADVVPAHRKENAHSVPLTLDELRKMEGEPVWVVCLTPEIYDEPPIRWRILEKSIIGTFGVWGNKDSCLTERDYGKTWIAYRQRP